MSIFQRIKKALKFYHNIEAIVDDKIRTNATNIQNLIENKEHNLKYFYKKEELTKETLTCKAIGISNEIYCDHQVIVSLTTYGKRIHQVYLVIESIMQGSIKPNKIILWLDNSFKDKTLPKTLQLQQERGLEIDFCKDIRSYKKLIPTLKKYPNDIIVTIDDDIIYDFDLLEKLINSYKKQPNAIHANRIHEMTFNEIGNIKPYMQWDWKINNTTDKKKTFFATFGGGALFPSHCFDQEVFNEDVFMNICPNADDVWFNAMALKNETPVVKAYTNSILGEDYIEMAENLEEGLKAHNTNSTELSGNDIQIKAVFEKYGLINMIKSK